MSEGGQPRSGGASTELRQRIVWGVILGVGALVAAIIGGWLLTIALAAVAFQVGREWASISVGRETQQILGVALPATAVILVAGMGPPWIATGLAVIAAIAVGIWLRSAWAAGGVVYAVALGISLVSLRADAAFGLEAVAFVFAIVWATDSAAYFTGRALGGPKLWPAVSPKKTWSGSIGGTVVAVVAGLVVALIAGVDGSTILLLIVALLLSIASQLGDLFESAIKRRFGTKDASQLIPGHGGAMDRIDGLLFAATLAAVIGAARMGWPSFGEGLLVW